MVLPSALLIPKPWEARLAAAEEKRGKGLGDEETAAMVMAVRIAISTPYLSSPLQGYGLALLSLSLSSFPRLNSGPTYVAIFNSAFVAHQSLRSE